LTKTCSGCHKTLTDSHFAKDVSSKDGLQSRCKDCFKLYETNPLYRFRRWALNTLKTHRKREGYTVDITVEELTTLAENTKYCSYCGRELNWERGNKGKSPRSENPTLDRVNNDTTLNLTNIKIVCMRCNTTKGYHTMKEFIEYCRSVVNYND
jgi:5-methylcytosine-specific restriction endonuclease McrA